jgi:O-antigen/teichoic acid export membrane protein
VDALSVGSLRRATFWVGLVLLASRFGDALKGVYLARLFDRAEVGLIAILLMLHQGIQVFTEMGHEAALVQRSNERLEESIDTAFIGAIGRGLLLSLGMAALSPWLARVYRAPELEPLLLVSASFLAIVGFKNLNMVLLQRNLQLKQVKLLMGAGRALDVVVTVGVAYFTHSIWAVVIGGIAGRVLEVLGSFWVAPRRPSWRFSKPLFMELLRFGRHIQAVSILVFLVTQLDDAVVAYVLSKEAVGVYALAYTLANLPVTQIVSTASQVAFPAWAEVGRQGNEALRNSMFLSTLRLTGALSVALVVALYVGGADLVELIYGAKWRDAELPLRILLAFGLARALGANFGALFNSMNRPQLITLEIGAKVLLIALAIYPMTVRWQLVGAALAVTVPMVLLTPIALAFYLRMAKIPLGAAAKTLLWPSTAGATMLLVWYCANQQAAWLAAQVWLRGLMFPLATFAAVMALCILVDQNLRATLGFPQRSPKK